MVDFQIPIPGLARDFNNLTKEEKDFIPLKWGMLYNIYTRNNYRMSRIKIKMFL